MNRLLILFKNLRTYICKHSYLKTKYVTRSIDPTKDKRLWKCTKCGICKWIGLQE